MISVSNHVCIVKLDEIVNNTTIYITEQLK